MNPQLSQNASSLAADLARMESIFALQQQAHARSPMQTLKERKRHLATPRSA